MIRLLTLLFFASLCLGELVPVSNYIGQHRYKCDRLSTITGELVQDKIYTFGGCYPIPYVVDPIPYFVNPSVENMKYMNVNRNNVSETIQIYDIKKDEWTHETEVKLPFPWRSASSQVYQQDIYFYNVRSAESPQNNGKMWKYDTVLKKFSALEDLPFNWHGSLKTCVNNGRMYFVGETDSLQRNVIRVYNIEDSVWEKPLFPNLHFTIEQMLCSKDAIHFLGAVLADEDNGASVNFRCKKSKLIRTDYITGDTIFPGLHIGLSYAYNYIATNNNDRFYYFCVQDEKTTIFEVDTVALVNRHLGIIPYTLKAPLFVPYQDYVFFLFGGGKLGNNGGGAKKLSGNLKTYNHKLVLETPNNFFK